MKSAVFNETSDYKAVEISGMGNIDNFVELYAVKQAFKRMFRKLEVSTRTQMVAKLQDILNSDS